MKEQKGVVHRSITILVVLLFAGLSSEQFVTAQQDPTPRVNSSKRANMIQVQACAVKKTIWTNTSSGTTTVTGRFWDECHEPEDRMLVSIFDKSGKQVATLDLSKMSSGLAYPLRVPAQGHIDYVCHSNSSTQEPKCKYEITEPPSKKADKDPCSTVFPIPDGADQWTNCSKTGGSSCGGPDQCACDASERLVQYSCTEGKYDKCTADSACSVASLKKPH